MNIQPDLFNPVWYTPKTLAQALGVSMATIIRYVKRGRVPPPQRWGYRTLRWHKDEVAHQVRFGPSPYGTYVDDPKQRWSAPPPAEAAQPAPAAAKKRTDKAPPAKAGKARARAR